MCSFATLRRIAARISIARIFVVHALLSFAFAGYSAIATAAVEQVWQYTINTISGATFTNLPDAEKAMRNVNFKTKDLILSSESITGPTGIVTRKYSVPPMEAEVGDWLYANSYNPAECHGSEGAAVAVMEAHMKDTTRITGESPKPYCSYNWVANGSWTTKGFGATTLCNIASDTAQTGLKPYKGVYSTRAWRWVGDPPEKEDYCMDQAEESIGNIQRVRVWSCKENTFSLKFVDVNTGYICVNDSVATITATLTQYPTCGDGNPCNAATGNKVQPELDLSGPLSFSRTFQSIGQLDTNSQLGSGWYHSYSAHLLMEYGRPTGAIRSTGYSEPLYRRPYTTNYVGYTGSGIQVEPSADGWTLFESNGSIENYDINGRLKSMVDAAGLERTFRYNDDGLIDIVTGPFGDKLFLNYSQSVNAFKRLTFKLTKVTSSNGDFVNFQYLGENLIAAVRSNQSPRIYHYESARFPNYLTGVTDENGDRFSTFSYDDLGRAILSEHSGGYERITLQYNADGTSTVTDAGGREKKYTYLVNGLGIRKETGITIDGKTTAITYNYSGGNPQRRVASRTDGLGHKTSFTYDIHHMLTRVEADGTTQKRTTTYQYFSEYNNLPTLVKSPSVYGTSQRQTEIAYTGNLPTQITQRGYTPTGTAISRTVTMQYNALGQVTQVDGPRTDANDISTFTYYANDPVEGGKRGQLQSVTNALGQTTTFDDYDAGHRLLQSTSPDNVVTTYSYDTRGRVLSVEVAAPGEPSRTTSYQYDNVGQVTRVTLPDGSTLNYAYNAAHLLTSITDALGNHVDYGYDSRGNRNSEKTYDTTGTLVRNIELAYDLRNNVSTVNTAGSITTRVFDAVSNLVTEPTPTTTRRRRTPMTRWTA